MSVQLALCFDEVPITCETQQRYHSIALCLAGKRSAEEQADALGLSYSTICRWLRKFREEGVSLRRAGLTMLWECQAGAPKGYQRTVRENVAVACTGELIWGQTGYNSSTKDFQTRFSQ